MVVIPFMTIKPSVFESKEKLYFKKEIAKILWFQLLRFEYFLVSLVLYDRKPNIFGLWTAGRDKTRHFRLHLGLWETLIYIFHYFVRFLKLINKLIIKKIICGSVDNENNPTCIPKLGCFSQ